MKSIYDDSSNSTKEEGTQQVSVPTRLSSLMATLRKDTTEYASLLKQHGQLIVSNWIQLEKSVAGVVNRTVPQSEKLMPGLVYIGLGVLAGPILARRKNLLVRCLAPWVVGGLTAMYVLPGTSSVVLRNVWGRYGDPQTLDKWSAMWTQSKQKTQELQNSLAQQIQDLRLSLQQGR